MSENTINHYEICCFLYAGNISQAQKIFSEKIKEQKMSPSLWNIALSSLNYAIYNFILNQENISLHECCLENIQRISHASGSTFLQTANEIINAYGMDFRYLSAKYKNPQIRSAIEYIHSHLSDELTLQNVSDTLYMNKNYFCQLFQKETGTSFSQYICLRRMNLARLLLSKTEMSIQEIALKCGFHTTAYFSTCCRKCFDCTPSQLRRANKLTVSDICT